MKARPRSASRAPRSASRVPAQAKLVFSFVRLLLPGGENCEGLLAHKLNHGNAPRFGWALQLFVNERVIEAAVGRIGGYPGVKDAGGAGPPKSARAQPARRPRGGED